MRINYVTPAFYCMSGSMPLGRQKPVCAIGLCNRNEQKYSCCVGTLISVSLDRRVINTYRCVKWRSTKVSCVLQPPTERFIVQPAAGRTWAAVIHDEADFARNAICVCPRIVRHLSDDWRGAAGSYNRSGRDCISLLLLSSPLSFLALFMILLATVRRIGFRTDVHFYVFYNGDEVTSQFVSVCKVRSQWACYFCSLIAFSPHFLFFFVFYVLSPSEFALK